MRPPNLRATTAARPCRPKAGGSPTLWNPCVRPRTNVEPVIDSANAPLCPTSAARCFRDVSMTNRMLPSPFSANAGLGPSPAMLLRH
jgi:hypothetical protein